MHKQLLLTAGVVLAGLVLVASGFYAGWNQGSHYPVNITVTDAIGATPQNGVQPGNMAPFWDVWKTIDENYLKNPQIPPSDKVSGAIKGLVGSLGDPYSEYFTAQESRSFQQDVQGNFGGIGAELGIRRSTLTVVSPLKDSPASQAGLRAGDAIIKINSSSTQDMPLDQAVSLIRGPIGSTVKLNIFRDGWDAPKDFSLTRQLIQVPTLDFSMKGDIAYIQLYGFNGNAEPLFASAAQKAMDQGAKGIVLDLRDNPGGYLDVAVDLAGWFLPKGSLVVSEESRIAPKVERRADGNEAFVHTPVVVLVNGGSASASEILAGALRDDRQVKLIGQQSFGKGTVQEIFPTPSDGSLKLTIAHWVLPSGKILENGGLLPDVEVKLTDQDIQNKKDPQLDKALEVMRGLIK